MGHIFDIQRGSTMDGPGFRTTVFFKGCNLRCRWCHNPESQSPRRQLLYYEDRCIHCGKCQEVCPHHLRSCDLCGACEKYCPAEARALCGKQVTVEEIIGQIEADRIFYQTSGGGATFSGGECLLQPEFLTALLRACRAQGIHTAVDTAGAVDFTVFEDILPYTGLFLYDVKCMDTEKHRLYTGVDNAQILENLARLLRDGRRVWIRVPVVPGVNDTVEEMQAIRGFLLQYGWPEKVELLPYHPMGESKSAALELPFTAFEVPDQNKIALLRDAILGSEGEKLY